MRRKPDARTAPAVLARRALFPLLGLPVAACTSVGFGLGYRGEDVAGPPQAPTERPASCSPATRLASVPVRYDRTWNVPVEVNGNPLQLALDTGASGTIISTTAAKQLGLTDTPLQQVQSNAIAGPVTISVVRVSSLRVGALPVPLDKIGVAPFAFTLEGLLGVNVLRLFDLDLDTRTGTLTLYKGAACPSGGPPWDEAFVSVGPLQRYPGHTTIGFPIEIDGQKADAAFDSGLQYSAIGPALAGRLGISETKMEHDPATVQSGVGDGREGGHVHQFDRLAIGPLRILRPRVLVTHLPPSLGDAAIGADFLVGRRLWLSLASMRMFVTPKARG